MAHTHFHSDSLGLLSGSFLRGPWDHFGAEGTFLCLCSFRLVPFLIKKYKCPL